MTLEEIKVPVAGGELALGTWGAPIGSGAPVVVAVHGITANYMSWVCVADELGDEVTLLAPDLRGRAHSASLPGPYGMTAHTDDLAAILDHLAIDTATVVGHSMGGFVAARFAVRHPERLAGLVLIDGGVTIASVPEDADIDAILNTILGPTMQRLSMTFADTKAWLDFWKAHPSLQEWTPAIEGYVMHDLAGAEPELRSSVNIDAIRADGADTLQGDGASSFLQLKRPTPWLRASRGLLNQVPPLYPDEVAAVICAEAPMLREQLVDDVNHFTIVISTDGAKIVGGVIRSEIPSAPSGG